MRKEKLVDLLRSKAQCLQALTAKGWAYQEEWV
jgi:hypothetical protein